MPFHATGVATLERWQAWQRGRPGRCGLAVLVLRSPEDVPVRLVAITRGKAYQERSSPRRPRPAHRIIRGIGGEPPFLYPAGRGPGGGRAGARGGGGHPLLSRPPLHPPAHETFLLPPLRCRQQLLSV